MRIWGLLKRWDTLLEHFTPCSRMSLDWYDFFPALLPRHPLFTVQVRNRTRYLRSREPGEIAIRAEARGMEERLGTTSQGALRARA